MTGPAISQKAVALARLEKCFELAKPVYEKDKERYKDIYSWINQKVGQHRNSRLVLRAIHSLKTRVVNYDNPPNGEVFAYLEGTLNKLEREQEGSKARRGDFSPIGEFTKKISEALKAQKK